MEFNDNDHSYKIIPDVLGIKEEYEAYLAALAKYEADPENNQEPEEVKPVICYLKPISSDVHSKSLMYQKDVMMNHQREKATELIAEDSFRLVDERCVFENLICGGKEIKTLHDARKHAPRSLVDYVVALIHSEPLLMEYEIKN